MNYVTWLEEVPEAITGDAVWKNTVYRQALFMGDLAWHDVCKLVLDRRTRSLADQLYRASGSISANICEGYSRASHKDQTRFYEYALGSAREARDWYFKGRHILGTAVADHRMNLLVEIIRQLLVHIPKYRQNKIKEKVASYNTESNIDLFTNIPMPPI